jgi:hypothetical protein
MSAPPTAFAESGYPGSVPMPRGARPGERRGDRANVPCPPASSTTAAPATAIATRITATPAFATGMEEVASIADVGGYGTGFAVETTGHACSTPESRRQGRPRLSPPWAWAISRLSRCTMFGPIPALAAAAIAAICGIDPFPCDPDRDRLPHIAASGDDGCGDGSSSRGSGAWRHGRSRRGRSSRRCR